VSKTGYCVNASTPQGDRGRDTAEALFRAGYTAYVSLRVAQGKNRQAAEALRKLGIKIVE
jgi:hypothetical protein